VQNYGAQVNLVVPWVIFDKERASVSQAQANLRASQDNENSVRQQVRLSVENAHLVLQQSRDETAFIRGRLLPEAQAAYRIALQNYTHASLAFSDLINAQNNLKNTELQLVNAEVNILIARSNLETAIGEKLQ
jgi:outer membrane protein TolC